MNNAYKAEEEKLIPFKTYLLKEEKISESTASDYIKRIITIIIPFNDYMQKNNINIVEYNSIQFKEIMEEFTKIIMNSYIKTVAVEGKYKEPVQDKLSVLFVAEILVFGKERGLDAENGYVFMSAEACSHHGFR